MIDRRELAMGVAGSLILPGLALAAPAELGPRVGSKPPPIGRPVDPSGKVRTLADLAGPKGVVLMFFRSASWCPFCQAQLIAMNEVDEQIAAKGWRLAGISYDTPEVLTDFIKRRNISYTLVSDPGSDAIRRWGLWDPQYPEGNRAYGVPRPIILFIDRSGTVRAKLYEETYQKRPPAELVVQTLDRLG